MKADFPAVSTAQGDAGRGKGATKKRDRITEDQQAEIRRLYQDGIPPLEIADRLDLTDIQVHDEVVDNKMLE